MPICWSWAFGPEDAAQHIDMGWVAYSTAIANADSLTFPNRTYSYSGSPVRYAMVYNGVGTPLRPPNEAVVAWQTTQQGCVSIPIKRDGVAVFAGTASFIAITDTGNRQITVTSNGTTGAFNLNIDFVFQETTPVYDASVWNYLCLKWKMLDDDGYTDRSWTAQVFMNGSAATAEHTRSSLNANCTGLIPVVSVGSAANNSNYGMIGQIILWDQYTDPAEANFFVTRANPTVDGTNVGTWTPGGALDSGTNGATGNPDTIFTSVGAVFTKTLGSVGLLSGVSLTIGATTVPVNAVVSNTELTVGTGLGVGLTGQTFTITTTDDFVSTRSPFNPDAYTEDAAPLAGHQLEMGTGILDTQLGVATSSVQAVTAHTYSTGQSITARAIVRDALSGTNSLVGDTKTIDPTSSTYTQATTTSKSGTSNAGVSLLGGGSTAPDDEIVVWKVVGAGAGEGTLAYGAGPNTPVKPRSVTVNWTSIAADGATPVAYSQEDSAGGFNGDGFPVLSSIDYVTGNLILVTGRSYTGERIDITAPNNSRTVWSTSGGNLLAVPDGVSDWGLPIVRASAVVIRWTSGGVPKAQTDDGLGGFTGDGNPVNSSINYVTGAIDFDATGDTPQSGTTITIDYVAGYPPQTATAITIDYNQADDWAGSTDSPALVYDIVTA